MLVILTNLFSNLCMNLELILVKKRLFLLLTCTDISKNYLYHHNMLVILTNLFFNLCLTLEFIHTSENYFHGKLARFFHLLNSNLQ